MDAAGEGVLFVVPGHPAAEGRGAFLPGVVGHKARRLVDGQEQFRFQQDINWCFLGEQVRVFRQEVPADYVPGLQQGVPLDGCAVDGKGPGGFQLFQ